MNVERQISTQRKEEQLPSLNRKVLKGFNAAVYGTTIIGGTIAMASELAGSSEGTSAGAVIASLGVFIGTLSEIERRRDMKEQKEIFVENTKTIKK